MKHMIKIAYDWAIRCFGPDHVANGHVCGLRLVEEAIEVCQSLGVRDLDILHKTVAKVYSKSQDPLGREIGGVMMTLAVLCESQGIDPEEEFERELRRVLSKEPKFFYERNLQKINPVDVPDSCTDRNG